MTRPVFALMTVVLLCTSSALLAAQTEAVINTRGRKMTNPTGYHFTGGTGGGSGGATNLKAVFTIDDPDNLMPDTRADYEMVITNAGKESVEIPQSPDWQDVDTGGSEQRYLAAAVFGRNVGCRRNQWRLGLTSCDLVRVGRKTFHRTGTSAWRLDSHSGIDGCAVLDDSQFEASDEGNAAPPILC